MIPRKRVISLLEFDSDRSLVIVTAPPGYGKSTAVAQWVSLQDTPTVWLSVDPSDRDVMRFLTIVIEGIRQNAPELVSQSAPLLSDENVSTEYILGSLIEEIHRSSGRVIIVVDDYHCIDSPEIAEVITSLIRGLKRQLRFLLITRRVPALPIARLQAEGEVLELGVAELRFDEEETSQFLESRGHFLSDEDKAMILQTTEGWVASLNLISLAINRLPESESIESVTSLRATDLPHLSQYIWQEVIDQIPSELQAFLFRISILDRFTVDLCNSMLHTKKAAEWIRVCEVESLFISTIDAYHIWFRFHPLFNDILRQNLKLRFSRAEIRRLHGRASRWFQANGFVLPAIHHAISAGDTETARSLLEDVCAAEFESDRVAELYLLLKDIDPAVLVGSPRLLWILAWAQLRIGLYREGADSLAFVEAAYRESDDRPGLGTVELWKGLHCLIAGDYPKALSHFEAALDLLSPLQETERGLSEIGIGMALTFLGKVKAAEQQFATVRADSLRQNRAWLRDLEAVHFGKVLMIQGDLHAAEEIIRQATDRISEGSTPIWGIPAMMFLSMIALEQNRLEEAESYLRNALQRIERSQSSSWRPLLLCHQARLERAQGIFEDALKSVRNAIEVATDANMVWAVSDARALEAEFYLADRQMPLVQRWAESCQFELVDTPPFERQAKHLVFARFLISTGDPTNALALLDRLRIDALKEDRRSSFIEACVVSALAWKKLGDSSRAVASLVEALALATELGFVQVFLKDWDSLAPLLRNIAAREHDRGYAARLLALREGQQPPSDASLTELAGEISRRELEVLRLVAVGMSNREIGERLFISEKTVKKHVSNIMAKLGTSNRTQSADLARQLNIVGPGPADSPR